MIRANTNDCLSDVILHLSCFSFVSAQVFPGELHIMKLEFVEQMAVSSSPIFWKTAANISSEVGCF